MLYPDFNELVRLGSTASRFGIVSDRRSVGAASGNYASPFRGQGLAFYEVREYSLGDDIRSIDWRVTARTDQTYVKIFTEERERTVLLCIDANAAMRFGTRGTFKSVQAARAAALLGWQVSDKSDRVGCLVFGDVPGGIQYFAPTRSRRAVWQTMRLLSRAAQGEHRPQVAMDTPLTYLERVAPTGALLLLIGDFLEKPAALERRLGNLGRGCDVVLFVVNDPADRELPAMETVIFEDDAGQKIVVDTESGTARAAYAEQWRQHRKQLEDVAGRRNIRIVDLHTDRDVQDDLLLGLRRLNLGKRGH